VLIGAAQELLARTVEPLPLDRFLDDVLGKRPIVLDAARCRSKRDLLGDDPEGAILDAYAELAPAITWHALAPTGPVPAVTAVPDAAAFRAKLAEFHERHYTVRIPGIRNCAPQMSALIRALEVVFHVPVDVEAFWSRSDGAAPVHFDDYDLIAVQLKGRKRWIISKEPSILPNAWKTIPNRPMTIEDGMAVEVGPGDLIYIPRGTLHTVEGIADSLHASIGFVPLTLREAVIACLDHLSEFTLPLRQTIAPHLGQQIATSDFGQLPERVRQAVGFLAMNCQADGFIANALQRRSSRLVGGFDKLATNGQRAPVTRNTRLRHHPLATAHLSSNESKIDFAYPGGHQYIHRGAEESLRFIVRTPEFILRDVPGEIGDDVRIALANQLVECGFLQVVDE
jgi:hypothetical protein